MGGSRENSAVRVLGLGNDLLADDAFGLRVARKIEERFGESAEVIRSSVSGLHLLEQVLGTERLIVVDTVITGDCPPGTVRVFAAGDARAARGGSPHTIGLFDALEVARGAGLAVPREISVVAVEAADCTTIGGAMHPAVEAAVAKAVAIASCLIRKEGPSA